MGCRTRRFFQFLLAVSVIAAMPYGTAEAGEAAIHKNEIGVSGSYLGEESIFAGSLFYGRLTPSHAQIGFDVGIVRDSGRSSGSAAFLVNKFLLRPDHGIAPYLGVQFGRVFGGGSPIDIYGGQAGLKWMFREGAAFNVEARYLAALDPRIDDSAFDIQYGVSMFF